MEQQVKLRIGKVEWRQVEGEIIALHLDKSAYLAINATGTVLWPLLVEGATKDVLAARLCEKFDLELVDATRDVDSFLSALNAHDLLTVG